MQSVTAIWLSLEPRRRLMLAGAVLSVLLSLFALSRLAGQTPMALLYSGLDPATAGEVVAALDSRGIPHEVMGDAIRVPEDQRDSLRMELAAEGLPAATGKGYELLDGLSGFGTTAQMFDAAQWRAVEGELSRTLLAQPAIRAARVHIARNPARSFGQDMPMTASVAVTPRSGGTTVEQAQAIRHLVAAAVAGLSPDQVQVIDTLNGLVAPVEDSALAAAEGKAAEIRQNVERLLAARVGPGRAVVEVAVDLVTETESITERKIDPEGRVAVSSESENQSGNQTSPGGPVTVASNLPEGQGAAGQAGSSSEKMRETVNYELSETRREVQRLPGDIRRLSVAVLVDAADSLAEDGTVTRQPRSEEELAVLRDLVASAVGLDEGRGDVLTLRSLEFQAQPEAGTVLEAGLFAGPLPVMTLVQTGALVLVVLVLGLFVIRPILAGARRTAPLLPLPLELADGTGQPAALDGVIDDRADSPALNLVGHEAQPGAQPAVPTGAPPEDPVARLRRLITERQAESMEILRGWMEAGEERG